MGMKVFTLWKLNKKRRTRLATIAGVYCARRRYKAHLQLGQRVELQEGWR